jgi:Tfp pilus assembly protein PilF
MSALLIAALLGAANPAADAELEYRPGELAYQALIRNDLSAAERQLRASSATNANDPAWLLNYGQFLARSGRVNDASAVFRGVLKAPETEVVLASGEVTSTRDASRRSLRQLRQGSLSAR